MPLSAQRIAELDAYYARQSVNTPGAPITFSNSPDKEILDVFTPDQGGGLTPERIAELDAYYATQNTASVEPQPNGDGFFDRVGAGYAKRKNQMQTIADQYVDGDISKLEADARMGLKYAQILPDVVGEGLVSGFRALPDAIETPIRQGASNVYSAVADTLPGRTVGLAVDLARGAYSDLEKNHPVAAGRLSSVADAGNLAAAFIPVGGTSAAAATGNALAVPAKVAGKAVKTAVSPAAKNTTSLAKGAMARSPDDLMLASEGMRKAAGGIYKQMRAQGAVLNPATSNRLIMTIDAEVAKNKFIPNLNPKTTSIIDDLAENIKKNNGQIGLDELDQYRRLLGRVGGSEDGVSAMAAKKAIDDMVSSLGAQNLAKGNASAVSLLKKGRAEYAKAARFDEVADIIARADGDPNKIKAGLTRFVTNKDNLKGFNVAEIAALKDAARNNVSEKLLKMFGKFGIDLGTSLTPGNTIAPLVGGYLASPALPLAGTAARQGQKYIARGKAEKALRQIEARP